MMIGIRLSTLLTVRWLACSLRPNVSHSLCFAATLCTILVKIYKDEAQKLLLYKTQASGVDWDEAANEACGLIREGHLELVQSSREIDHRRTFPPDTLHSRIASQKRSLPTISVSQALSAGRELPRVSCSTPDSWRRAPAPLSPRRRTATSSYQGSSTVIGNMAGSEYSSLHVSKAPSSTRKGARS